MYYVFGSLAVLVVVVLVIVWRQSRNLHALARAGFVDRLRARLAADPKLANARDRNEETPLHHAAKFGEIDAVKLLVESGSDVNAKRVGGGTPMHYAAWYGCPEVVEYLLSKGADPTAKTEDGLTPLDMARKTDQQEIIAIFTKSSENIRVM